MKHLKTYLSLALTLALCMSLAACGESNEDYGDDGSDYNFYGVPDSFEGLVKDSEQMSNLYVFGGAWRGEGGETLISATSDAGDEVRFALYDADEEVTASGFIQFVPEYDYDYFYNEHDGVAYRSWFDEVGTLYVDSLGTFTKILGDAPGENVGDGDPTTVDCGTIEVNQDGAGQYFAASAMYEDVVYDFTLVGDDVIYWGGEYDYYQKMA
mgnify:CR=1 FL=1